MFEADRFEEAVLDELLSGLTFSELRSVLRGAAVEKTILCLQIRS